MYDLEPGYLFWAWAGLAALLLAIEVLVGAGWLLWAAASALATGVVAALLGMGVPAAIVLFAVLTIVSTLAARRYLPKRKAESSDINDNLARLAGHKARASSVFLGGRGRVTIDGKEWAAELSEGGSVALGEEVEVISIDGARLTVRRLQA